MNSNFLFIDKIHDSVSRIETWLALPSTANSTNSNASNLDSVSSNPKHNHYINAKLLKVEIPKCNGKPLVLQSFGDLFSAAVDSKINIPDVVKLSFSKGDLYKDVQEPICGLLVTNKNYSITLKTFTGTLYKWTSFNKFLYGKFCIWNIAIYNIYEKCQWVKSNIRFSWSVPSDTYGKFVNQKSST